MADHMPLVVAGFVILVVVALVVMFLLDGKQHEENQAFAQERGWRYRHDNSELQASCRDLPFGRKGSHRRTQRTFTGEDRGLPFEAFEYHYEISGSGDESSSYYHYQVTRITLPHPCPVFSLEPSGLGHTIANALGMSGTTVDDPEFNKAFKLSATAAFAAGALGPENRRWILADPRFRARSLRLDGTTLTTWHKGKLDKTDLRHALDFLHDARQLLALEPPPGRPEPVTPQ
ncbi:hypothetical protein [Segniliparus rugosus]|uniref:DUF3137 domain-containing protein n=1 Tax=Segniliparus rugosus (strain ATCC BAA-974 / DSM 45345 / CCUG 50838 / CIP 108380 / JCM 13579 / CDC 945) TaxID=679197 RepID=E5XQS6_SEGRC|nr:hypothetical protein [Segniliparus rugosus]EFV13299.1 hypothetical protein HMPREF9336_01848 [Segniliparus rugosus ATCC BAA-974]